MKLTSQHYKWIEDLIPKHRKRPVISNLVVLNAMLYAMEKGCKWRALPSEYGNWHTIYTRINRWAKSGLLQKIFLYLQAIGAVKVKVKIVSLDSTSIKVHPHGMGSLKKAGNNPLENQEADSIPNFIWSPHLIGTQ